MSSASRRLSLLLLSLIIIIIFFFFFTAAVVSVSAHGGSVHHSNDDEDAGAAGAGEKQPNQLRERGLVLVKIYCLVLVFIGTFAGGISPYFFKWSDGFLVLGTQFAGGVFLGTAMMHFLPDANETFEDLMATSTVSYPFAFMLATVGYMMTMLADALVVGVYDRRDQLKITMTTAAANLNNGGGRRGSDEEIAAAAAGKLAGGDRDASLSQAGGLIQARSLGDNVLLIIALCFHSVFEGIAIGVAETKDEAWKALWTISLHKIFAAIAMGIALLRMIPNRPFLSCATYAFVFAISSPVGVAIGIIIDATTQGAVADWIYAISMGLACGVFIYVSINHLLAKGYVPEKPTTLNSSFTKFGAVLIGVGVIAVVMIWDT